MKRVLTLFLALVFAIGICFSAPITFTASAADDTTSEFYFILNDDKKSYSIEAYEKSKVSGHVALPSKYNGLPVTKIDPCAFVDCTGLTGVTIPDSIVEIGWSAFSGCTGITSVTIPDSVKIVGDSAFQDCSGVTTIKIGNKVEEIGSYAFSNTAIKSIVIPNSVKSIEYGAFYKCADLANVTMSNNVTKMGSGVFSNTAYFADTTKWQNGALYINKCLVAIDSTIKDASYSVKQGTTCIADGFLNGASYKLVGINIPSTVVNLTVDTFDYGAIEKINVDSNNPNYSSVNGVLFNKSKTELIYFPQYNKTESYTIPSTVNKIGYQAFYSNDYLKSVVIPDSVTVIENEAFYFAYALDSIALSKNIKRIGQYAFDYTAFYKNENNWDNGVLYCGNYLITTTDDLVGDYTIKAGTVLVADYAFYSRDDLTSVVVPNSVKTLGINTFRDCDALKSVTLSTALTEIPEYCFYYTYGLVSVTIPNSVTKICKGAFQGSYITKVVIGTGVKTIEDDAFEYCSKLEKVEYKGKVADWWKISIGANNEDLLESRISTSDKALVITTPVVEIRASSYGMYVNWSSVAIADSYKVYRSTYNASTKKWSGWKHLKTVKYVGYSDDTVRVGTKYKYTVRAVVGNVSSDYKGSNSVKYDVAPTVKISNASNGIKVTWNTIAQVKTYRVYSSTYNTKTKKWSGWKNRGNVNGTTWIDKSAKSGTKYKYAVRAIDGKSASSYKGTSGLLFLAQPKTTVKAVSNGVKVSWTQITGATSYKIYRSEYNTKTKKWSSWKGLKTAKSTSKSYIDKSAKKGVKYKYTVKAVNGKTTSAHKSSDSIKR